MSRVLWLVLSLAMGQARGQSVGSVRFSAPRTQEATVSATNRFEGKPATIVYVLGKRTQGWGSTSAQGDVAQYLDLTQDALNPVSTATTYFLRSSSASDTAAGIGARTVRIVYLNASGAQLITTATLNGVTGVSLGSGFSYFQWAEVATVGTNLVSVGNLTISSNSGAPTTAEIVEYIAAGGNRSFSARYKVPTGQTGFLVTWSGTMIGGADMDIRLRSNVFADDRSLSSVLHFQSTMYLAATAVVERTMYYLKFPAGAEIKVSAIVSATGANNRLDASFKLIVVDN